MEQSSSRNNFRDSDEWKLGHQGELDVAKILQKKGWYIIPSYDYSGEDGNKAPKMQGASKSLVLPDLDISKEGKRLWAEVKTKSTATLYRKTNTMEHGISLRHYRDYLDVQQITGCEVWLWVVETDTKEVLFAKLNGLAEHGRIYNGDKMGRSGMIFFPRSKFRKYCLRS